MSYTYDDSLCSHPKYEFYNYEEHIATDPDTGYSHASIKINRDGNFQRVRQYTVGFDPSYYPDVFFAQVKIDRDVILETRGKDPVSAVLTLTLFILANNQRYRRLTAEHLNRALDKYQNFVPKEVWKKSEAIQDRHRRGRARYWNNIVR